MGVRPDPTPLVRPLACRRRNALWHQDAVAAQRYILRRLLTRAAPTRFGRDHGFAQINDVVGYQRAVPLRTYEDFWRAYWEGAFPVLDDVSWPGRIPFFAVTSGTTSGRTKHVPLTHATLAQNRRAALDMTCVHVARHPESRLLGGRSFFLGGSTALDELAPGVLSGDLSGIVAKTAPAWMRPFTYPPAHVALEANWDAKLENLAHGLENRRIRALSGVPAWMLVLFDRLEDLYDRWPLDELELLIHGGVAWAPYRRRFEPYLARSRAVTREVYPASEGFIAFQDRGSGEGLLLSSDTGLFFEFVPVEELGSDAPRRHWLATVEPGIDYALALASPSGLFAYLLGDIVRFVDTNPPRLLITGRTAYMLSVFGEHLIQEELDQAILGAVAEAGAALAEYIVGAVLPAAGLGHHRIYVEADASAPLHATRLASSIDARLAALNDDYAAHRQDGTGMGAPDVRLLAPGTCAAWMRSQGKLGGQHKVPRVIADTERFAAVSATLDRLSLETPDQSKRQTR